MYITISAFQLFYCQNILLNQVININREKVSFALLSFYRKHMIKCKLSAILDPIRAVSDHLSERVTLEANEDTFLFVNQFGKHNSFVKTELKGGDCSSKELIEKSNSMNNNIMFRSMFFMNDEPRHFLASHIPVIQNETEYFQRKQQIGSGIIANSVGSGGGGNLSSTVGSQTNPGEISTQTVKVLKQRPHTCEECGKTFLLKHHLATHIRVHTGERPHVCPECGKTFALKHCLSTHLLLHSAERPYKCNECNKSFTLKHHLVSHEKMHTRERPFECRECGQTFSQKRHLSTHLKFHSGERPFSCQVCGETFTREEHLVMHSRFHGGLQPYICSDCGAGFLRKFQLVEHERQHGRCPDACPSCGKEFLQKRTLLLHVRTCGLTPNPHSIQLDHGTHLTKVCKECGEAFSSAEGLALHMRLHIGDHSFLSDICSLAASLKQAAGTQTPLMSSLKKTHSCPDCNRSFTQKHGLNQHSLRYPNGACKLKPFRCEKCGKAFSQKNHLVLHERQHMEPSERSELKHRNSGSIENSQNNLMRQLDVNRDSQIQQLALQQKPHMVLHERQMDAVERAQISKPRSLTENNQMMRHMEITDQSDQHQVLKVHHSLHERQMDSQEDHDESLIRQMEIGDQKLLQQQHSIPINKSHQVLHDRQIETSERSEGLDSTPNSLSRFTLELSEAPHHSISIGKNHHILQQPHERQDATERTVHSSGGMDSNQTSLMRHLELTDQTNAQQHHTVSMGKTPLLGLTTGDRNNLNKRSMDGNILKHSLLHGKSHHILQHERSIETGERTDSAQTSLLRHLEHPMAHSAQ